MHLQGEKVIKFKEAAKKSEIDYHYSDEFLCQFLVIQLGPDNTNCRH